MRAPRVAVGATRLGMLGPGGETLREERAPGVEQAHVLVAEAGGFEGPRQVEAEVERGRRDLLERPRGAASPVARASRGVPRDLQDALADRGTCVLRHAAVRESPDVHGMSPGPAHRGVGQQPLFLVEERAHGVA